MMNENSEFMNENFELDILGTNYRVIYKDYDEDTLFAEKGYSAYCNGVEKKIVICNHKTIKCLENNSDYYYRQLEKVCLRHEIIHAFLYESGLSESSLNFEGSWATNEEMIDFFAMQAVKMFGAFLQASTL